MIRGISRRGLLKALAAGGLYGGSRVSGAGAPEAPLFRDIAAETGLNFHHSNGATGQHYMPEAMGPGGALFDYDGDLYDATVTVEWVDRLRDTQTFPSRQALVDQIERDAVAARSILNG